MGGVTETNAVGGWTKNVKAPSTAPFNESDIIPKEITEEDIQEVKNFWLLALTCKIHDTHGYLLSSFLRPSSKKRTDKCKGSFETDLSIFRDRSADP